MPSCFVVYIMKLWPTFSNTSFNDDCLIICRFSNLAQSRRTARPVRKARTQGIVTETKSPLAGSENSVLFSASLNTLSEKDRIACFLPFDDLIELEFG